MIQAEHVDRAAEILDGLVSHDDPPPDVECKVSVVCQEIGMSQGVEVNNTQDDENRQGCHEDVSFDKCNEL